MRLLWVIINVAIWTTICGLLAILVGLVDRCGRGVRWVARLWARLILAASGVSYTITGHENLDCKKPYIFAGNHESAFDILLSFAAIPQHIVSIAKIELRRIPVLGWAMIMAGHIFVDRKNHERALESMEKAKESIRKNPRSILIFPEGTRSLDGEIHEFKKGAAVLGITMGIPIVPMAMCGTGEVVRKNSWKLNPQPVELRLGQPIDATQYKYAERSQLNSDLRAAVVDLRQKWQEEQQTKPGK